MLTTGTALRHLRGQVRCRLACGLSCEFPLNGNGLIRNVGGTQVPVPLDLAVLAVLAG
ncbi:MAG: hypothetical protein LBE08_08730 [Bifidobacteriaceae bacterium]|jgi:hypothetical protein|nr:hypothetical protein [Bifidobacteriaceae bacterium]